MDPTNPAWGWSWLERWMAARPWESHSLMEKEKNDRKVVIEHISTQLMIVDPLTKGMPLFKFKAHVERMVLGSTL